MEHNLASYRSQLLLSKLYVASPGFPSSVRWEQGKAGNVLSDRATKSNTVMAVVGRVLANRMNVEPHGNFNRQYGPLEGAKFQLQLVKPVDTPFEKDFDKAVEVLTKMQGQAAATQDRRNFIVVKAGNKNFRFGEHVFHKRPEPIDVDAGQEVDQTMENWPVSPDYRADLDKIKFKYAAVPLSVFINDLFVPAEEVSGVVQGALVELHFQLFHYHIRSKTHDSFNGSIEQVIVLQPSQVQTSSPYKRKNVDDGPIRLKPSPFVQASNRSMSTATVKGMRTVETEKQPVAGPSTRRVLGTASKEVVEDRRTANSVGTTRRDGTF
ncbi:hypothetical protein EDB83DRAFT_2223259 [Lactarius deliciosus]|nr:hypothetical protein EDB83DRAFT_2223259 [Lactarius deliciosus]